MRVLPAFDSRGVVPLVLFAALAAGGGCTADPAAPPVTGAGADAASSPLKPLDAGDASSKGDGKTNGERLGTPRDGGAPTGEVVGGFTAMLVAADPATGTPAYTAVQGKVFDGPVPPNKAWKQLSSGNGCQLLEPQPLFCDPPCESGFVCGAQSRCVKYPAPQNLGKVTVTGLGAAPFDMEPILGDYSPAGDVQVPNPPCAEGDGVRIKTAGGAYASFQIDGPCIPPLALGGPARIPLKMGEPIRLTWTASQRPELGRVQVRLDISHHGGQKGEITCDVADTGALEIPAALVTGLVNLGVAGFPTIEVIRRSTAWANIPPGRAVLEISSRVERPVDIPGIISCNQDEDCPTGKTCRPDRTCR